MAVGRDVFGYILILISLDLLYKYEPNINLHPWVYYTGQNSAGITEQFPHQDDTCRELPTLGPHVWRHLEFLRGRSRKFTMAHKGHAANKKETLQTKKKRCK